MGTIWEAINQLQLEMKEARREIKALKGGKTVKKKAPKLGRMTGWKSDDEWAGAFGHLNRIPAYKRIFDARIDGPKLTHYDMEYGLTRSGVSRAVQTFADYWEHNTKPMKNPRGSLAVWMGNQRDWKLADKNKPKSIKDKRAAFDEKMKAEYTKANGPERTF